MRLAASDKLRLVSQQVIPGVDIFLTQKYQLAKTLWRATDVAAQRGQAGLFDIAPRTFVFPGDFAAWRAVAAAEPETIWIAKPGTGARGEGIFLVADVDAVEPEQNLVMQEYIASPHLLDGYKYTLRLFVLVTSFDPLRAWVYKDGLTKLTTQPFTTDPASFDNLFIHLTNPDVLRGDTSADFAGQRFLHTEYRRRLREAGHDDVRLFKDIHTVIAKSLLAVREVILYYNARHATNLDGTFMLLGYDILVDANMRPWLIEINSGPSMETEAGKSKSGREEARLKEAVATDTLRLAGVLPKARVQFEPLFPSAAMKGWLPCYEILHEQDKLDLKNFA